MRTPWPCCHYPSILSICRGPRSLPSTPMALAWGAAVSNMIARNLKGVEFLVCNTDAQHLSTTLTDNRLQLGRNVTEGLGCGANPDAGRQVRRAARVRPWRALVWSRTGGMVPRRHRLGA